MDNCFLEELSFKPAKLSPSFKQTITEYTSTVPSGVETVFFECMTADNGASYSLLKFGDSRTLKLEIGENEFVVDVAAEDGTQKLYKVKILRQPENVAYAEKLRVGNFKLDPEFCKDVLRYSCRVNCDSADAKLVVILPDPKIGLTVNGSTKTEKIAFNVGTTFFDISVTSVDQSTSRNYVIEVCRDPIQRYLHIADSTMDYLCPFTLAPYFSPLKVAIDEETTNVYSTRIFNTVTRRLKEDPLSGQPLTSADLCQHHNELDTLISVAQVCVPQLDNTSLGPVVYNELGALLKKIPISKEYQVTWVKTNITSEFQHKIESRRWEKELVRNTIPLPVEEMQSAFAMAFSQYQVNRLTSPSLALEHIDAFCRLITMACQVQPKVAAYHFMMAQGLEERYYAYDTLPTPTVKSHSHQEDMSAAIISSKEEEINAICELYNCSAGANLSLKLKALDQEYQNLKSNMSTKAEHVQNLYNWKSKQATLAGSLSIKCNEDTSNLGQSILKYMDALSLDETKAVYNIHVGRMLLMKGQFVNSITRLKIALDWNDQLVEAKMFLGLALAEEGLDEEAFPLLKETLENVMNRCNKCIPDSALFTDNLVSPFNILTQRALVKLAEIQTKLKDLHFMSPKNIYHCVLVFACQSLTSIPVARGHTYEQHEWIILNAHKELLLILIKCNTVNDNAMLKSRIENLLMLTKCLSISNTGRIAEIQLMASEILVYMEPMNMKAILALAQSQLMCSDQENNTDKAGLILENAKNSFIACIELEKSSQANKNTAADKQVLPRLKNQSWYIKKMEEEKKQSMEPVKGINLKSDKKANPVTASAVKKPAPTSKTATSSTTGTSTGTGKLAKAPPGGVAGRKPSPGKPGRANPTAPAIPTTAPTTGPRAKANGAKAKVPAPPAVRTPAGKNTAATTTTAGPTNKTPTTTTTAAAKTTNNVDKCAKGTIADKKSSKLETDCVEDTGSYPHIDLGDPSNLSLEYRARYGLAKILSRQSNTKSEAIAYYREVIDIAREFHSGYADCVYLLIDAISPTNEQMMSAVDIYGLFPLKDSPNFDDAFIYGEIIRYLIKCGEIKDDRLKNSMIGFGRVMGVGALDKFVDAMEKAGETKTLCEIFAAIHKKDITDPDLVAYFKVKFWM